MKLKLGAAMDTAAAAIPADHATGEVRDNG